VAHWGFGRGRMRLNPAPAGWHRGEREVSAPQHTTHKIVSSGGEETRTKPEIHTNTGLKGSRFEQIILWV